MLVVGLALAVIATALYALDGIAAVRAVAQENGQAP
jgi:hypothetical protein